MKLGDVIEFRTGKLNSNAAVIGGKYPFFTCSPETLSIDTYAFDGDVILLAGNNANGDFNIKRYHGKFNAYQRTYVITTKDNADIDFLYYSLKLALYAFKQMSQGTATRFLTAEILRNFEIELPALSEQIEIGRTLSALDNKITNNNAINRNLEQMAQAVFKSWFVDFEPWGGVIPEDWRETKLSELVETVGGYSYKSSELVESTTAMATIKNFERGGGFKLDGFKEIEPSSKVKPSQFVCLYETIVAHTDLTQKAEVIGNAEMLLSTAGYEKIVASMDLVKVIPSSEGLSKFILGAILRSPLFKEHCLGYVNGTTVLHLSKRAIPEYTLVFPNNPTMLTDLDTVLSLIYRQISLNIDESARLVELRDTLLPRLMSGEIQIPKEV